MTWRTSELSRWSVANNWPSNWVKILNKIKKFNISGLEFYEASAKENINVKAVFEKLVEVMGWQKINF